MRIGLCADLHLGHSGVGRWHNRLLFDRAEQVARSAVAALNRQGLDAVVVLGDVTNDGTDSQLAVAADVLGSLAVPWYVIPGNHDRAAFRSGRFDEAFAGHAPREYVQWGDVGALFLRELPPDESDPSRPVHQLGPAAVESAVAGVASHAPRSLLVFCHVSLAEERAFADEHAGLYADHHADGALLLERVAALVPGRVVVFCGHQHWHHVLETPTWVQCTTAALIEYPMEARVCEVAPGAVWVETLPTADAAAAAESLDGARWVRGQEGDRRRTISLARD